jgi:hypothetical protein
LWFADQRRPLIQGAHLLVEVISELEDILGYAGAPVAVLCGVQRQGDPGLFAFDGDHS